MPNGYWPRKVYLVLEMENLESQVNEMKDIQREWKTIGFVPRKLDNKLWKEFSNTHRDFFDRIKSNSFP